MNLDLIPLSELQAVARAYADDPSEENLVKLFEAMWRAPIPPSLM